MTDSKTATEKMIFVIAAFICGIGAIATAPGTFALVLGVSVIFFLVCATFW